MSLLVRAGWVGGLIALVGCSGTPTRVSSWSPPACDAQAVVVVIDGAGGFTGTYQSVTDVVKKQQLPLQVLRFDWVHRSAGFIADQTDTEYSRAAGQRLAEQVRCLQVQAPGKPVYLLAHSAGSAVALVCAESLPPDSLQRIVLLAPAVSKSYDLRPALICSRQGIDVFCSERDRFYLGLGIRVLGTADGKRDDAAGRTGFCNAPANAADAALYSKLHQHPWDPCQAWTGNYGQHNGTFREPFMRSQIVPLLWPGA